jgi:predicted dehydrogenase
VHYVDVIRFVTSAYPKRVMAIGQKTEIIKHGIDTYDAIQCIIDWEMPDGTQFTQTILTSWVDPETSTAISDQKIKFIGTKGRYEADQKERGIRINSDDLGVQHINPDFCMSYGVDDGDIYWHGYGIESITTFLNDIVSLEGGIKTLLDLEGNRPTFRESLISTMVTEAAHKSLEAGSSWEAIEKMQ